MARVIWLSALTFTSTGQPFYDQAFGLELSSRTPISKVSLIRVGSVTHAWNMEQRFVELNFTQEGNRLSISAPERPELAPPGSYMLFVVDADGVPSEAAMVSLPLNTPDPEPEPQPRAGAGRLTLNQSRHLTLNQNPSQHLSLNPTPEPQPEPEPEPTPRSSA